jgi:class 3 adenylate cyclase/tetratricopeptide (TPR) repeat protein
VATEAPAAPREERRWATLLFADLSGFTSLSARLDPEDVKALAHECTDRLSAEVRRFGGTILSIAGDQVMAAFGAPVAHEDDAERAVRAGLAMRNCDLRDPSGQPIKIHAGINTGEVMAGLIGPSERRDYAVMGDTTNVAARLMGAAPAGSVLVGEETWRATRRVVRYRELPPLLLKGKEQPVPVWEALEAADLGNARPLGTARLVGRDQELALLSDIWLKVVRDAHPQLVTILGEPGIGKSRLVAEFERRFCESATVLHGRCLPYGEALGYWALAAMIKEVSGITAADDLITARQRLSALIQKAMPSSSDQDLAEMAAQVALLTGLEVEADQASAKVDQRTLHGAVRRLFEGLAQQKPVCLMFEDIHWADGALLDLIEFLASRAKDAPLLIVAQTRPALLEKRPNWGAGVRSFTSLSLEPLSEAHGSELVSTLCRERGLPENLVAQVGRGAGGNPLFAEELVLMIAERGAGAGVPSAIKALIAARLDALPPDQRRLIQIAAAFGKVFWEGGLRALGLSQDLAASLEMLEQKDLLRMQPRSQFKADQEFSFKHDLIRDVAYDTLPRSERRKLHGSIADWLERTAQDKLDLYLDQLAHHSVQAGQEERAINYLKEAAQRARRMSAHVEEARLLLHAAETADQLGRTELQADLLGKRGAALVAIGRWPEARQDLEKALTGLAPHSERLGEVFRDLSSACLWMSDGGGQEHAQAALAIAEQTGRESLAVEALALIGFAGHTGEGDLFKAWDHYRLSLERGRGRFASTQAYAPHTLYMLGRYEQGAALAEELVRAFEGKDALAIMQALPHLGLNLAASGRYREAALAFERARQCGREYESWALLARSISMSSGYRFDLFDFAGAEHLAEEARDLAEKAGFQSAVLSAGIDLLFNYVHRGDLGRAETSLPEVQAAVDASANWHRWLFRLRLAQVQAELALGKGEFQSALEMAQERIATQDRGRIKYEVLARIVKARALHGLGQSKQAALELRTALDQARNVKDPTLLLRVAGALLEIAGDDELLRESNHTVDQVRAALTDDGLRQCFEAADTVKMVRRLRGTSNLDAGTGDQQTSGAASAPAIVK